MLDDEIVNIIAKASGVDLSDDNAVDVCAGELSDAIMTSVRFLKPTQVSGYFAALDPAFAAVPDQILSRIREECRAERSLLNRLATIARTR